MNIEDKSKVKNKDYKRRESVWAETKSITSSSSSDDSPMDIEKYKLLTAEEKKELKARKK